LLVACIIVFAHFVETTTGFGATVIALALAAHIIPIKTLVAALVLIAWLQSAWIVARGFKHIGWDILIRRILPLAALGLPLGMWGFSALGQVQLKVVLGTFVMAVAAHELAHLYLSGSAPRPVSRWKGAAALVGGGFFHGLFASGGPLIVYYASRQIEGKRSFRATISVLWLMLNTALIASYAVSGGLGDQSVVLAAYLLPALAVGVLAGEILHTRIREAAFKKMVQAVLFFTGVFLLV